MSDGKSIKAVTTAETTQLLPAPSGIRKEWSEGFHAYSARWFGEEGKANAIALRDYFKSQGRTAGLYTNTERCFNGKQYGDHEYYKVFLNHPKDPMYYAWFAPETVDKFADPIDFEHVTWFEFIRSDK